MKNPLSSLEFMISNKITVIGLWGIGIILLFYSLNVNTIKRIHSDYEKDQANTIEEKEKRIETLEGINRLLTRNTHLIGTKLLCISAVIPVTNNNKLAAISDENESVYARSRMNGILKSIVSNSTKTRFYYVTDYPVLGEKIKSTVYCTVDTATVRKSNIDTPMIAVLNGDNTVLCALNLYYNIEKEAIDTIIKTIKTITKPTNDKK
jgi:hypothetical protein